MGKQLREAHKFLKDELDRQGANRVEHCSIQMSLGLTGQVNAVDDDVTDGQRKECPHVAHRPGKSPQVKLE